MITSSKVTSDVQSKFKALNTFARAQHEIRETSENIDYAMILADSDPDGEVGTGTSFIYYNNKAGTVDKFNPNKDPNIIKIV